MPSTPFTSHLPADAPFNHEQRLWLNGFLAGLVTIAERAKQQAAANAGPPADATPLAILYGSQSGNCEALSKDLRKLARASGFAPNVSELDAFDRATLPETQHLLIVTSTFGEGDPPDNAKDFYEYILSDDAPDLTGVNYAVCSMGDRAYTHFCKAGIDIDERMAELGATRIAERVDCDVDYDELYGSWKSAVFESQIMQDAAAEVDAAALAAATEEADDGHGDYTKDHPFTATLLCSENLNGEGSAKETRHIEIALDDPAITYEAGDALGVWATNCPNHACEIIDAVGLAKNDIVTIKGATMTLLQALIAKRDLTMVTAKLLEIIPDAPAADDVADLQLVDVLEKYDIAVDAQGLVDALRPMQPRLYSIASSPLAHPGQVHLTVGAVRYDLHGKPRKGVASTCLADRLPVGAALKVYSHPAPHFKLPEDNATPIIMCGPCTGIAPFRGFLHERKARGGSGPCWLFFGDQHEACDFLYRKELTEFMTDGTLTNLSTAFSRDGDEKVYVQNRMAERGAEIWQWLQDGAYFFVCGDASRMAKDVDKMLHTIVAEHGSMTEEQAADYIKQLAAEKRYARDVY